MPEPEPVVCLTRLTVQRNRTGILWLSNPYQVHARLKTAWAGDPRLLWRLETTPAPQILVQATTFPDLSQFNNFRAVAAVDQLQFPVQLEPEGRYRFRLRANPVMGENMGRDRRSKRRALREMPEAEAWLWRKLQAAGAEVERVAVMGMEVQVSRKKEVKDITHWAVTFEGVLKVVEPALLQQAILRGIGPAKGFGFGLLSLKRL